jgi:hypothetical protein
VNFSGDSENAQLSTDFSISNREPTPLALKFLNSQALNERVSKFAFVHFFRRLPKSEKRIISNILNRCRFSGSNGRIVLILGFVSL